MFSRQPKHARPTSFRCQHPGRSCRTTGNCCGSCSSGSGSSLQCMAYTSGDTCSNTPISCPTLFDPLPSDETGSRPSGSCPASRPYQTDKGCCGACRTDQGTVMAFDCGTTCSSSPRPGRFVHSRHLPPPSILPGVSCAAFDGLSHSSGGTCAPAIRPAGPYPPG